MDNNNLFINWKYNGETIFKSNETDYHCGTDTMEIKRNKEEIWFKLRPKTTAPSQIIKLKPVANLDYMEVWTCDGKYYQHDLNFSHLISQPKSKISISKTKKDTSYLDEHQKELKQHLDPEKSASEILKGIKNKKKN